ncbi:hypothetical protein C8R45DRAFT_896683 [Mycena sanguinolenta]|nr:hypothetical protein C8R45DRAFT_896683 [Mycena sanguinolenta]
MTSESTACVDCGEIHPARHALNSSPFHSFLTAQGRMPDASETAAIREFVRDTDAEIAQRESAIRRLQCEVAELRRRSDECKSIIAPIRRVPAEIMAEIFLQLTRGEKTTGCSYPYDFAEGASFFHKNNEISPALHKAPLIFGEVSRRWRNIALSTPRLWNSIFLRCEDETLQDNIALCDMWLKRSGSLPLSIRLYRLSDPVHCRDTVGWQTLMRTVLPYAHRWVLLGLGGLPSPSYDILYDHLPDSLPVIETLVLNDDRATHSLTTPWPGLRTAPKLRFLHFSNVGDTRTGNWPTFPWSQLTHIDVGGCSSYDCLHLLHEASAAVACRFLIERSSPLQHPPVFNSSVQTLKIQVYIHASIQLSLTCPQLSTLAIWMQDSELPPHDLPAFIARSGANIVNFTLEGFNLNDTQFIACLACMPRLWNLRVEEYDGTQFTNQVLESLTWRPSSSTLIPDLESLDLEGGRAFSHKAVVGMLESRVRPPDGLVDFVPKLKTVHLRFWRKMSSSAFRRLTALETSGLNITLDTTSTEESETGSEASGYEELDDGDGEEEDP